MASIEDSTLIRLVRKDLSEKCLAASGIDSTKRARLLAFAESVVQTAVKLAGENGLNSALQGMIEPIDTDMVTEYAELERDMNDVVFRLNDLRKNWKSKVDKALEAEQEALEQSIKFDESKAIPAMPPAEPHISGESVEQARQDLEHIQKLEDDLVPKLPSLLDRCEITLTTLQHVPLPVQAAGITCTELAAPVNPEIAIQQSLTLALEKNIEERRKQLRST